MSSGLSLIGVLYVGNDLVSFTIFDLKRPATVICHKIPITPLSHKIGILEYDPLEWLKILEQCVQHCGNRCKQVRALGICNKHTTIVIWDKQTGKPYCNAIASNDGRIESIINRTKEVLGTNEKKICKLTGWTSVSHCSLGELIWFRDTIPDIDVAFKDGRAMVGTIDTWLLWQLTGGVNEGVFATDVTNASRTMLMNLATLDWDDNILDILGINRNVLPTIRSNAEEYGQVKNWASLNGVLISGIIEERQATLIGHACLTPGCALNTYSENCVLTFNIGELPSEAPRGLRTTVAHKLGTNKQVSYALEGYLPIGCDILRWIHQMHILISPTEKITDLVKAVTTIGTLSDCGGVYFVPAFRGLGAPYWRSDARGIICGLTRYVKSDHIARAALQALCFQTREIFDLIRQAGVLPLHELHVNGEICNNSQFLPLLADIIGFKLKRDTLENSTPLGAAIAAGCALNVDLCDPESTVNKLSNDIFHPTASVTERMAHYGKWQMAIKRSFGWHVPNGTTLLPVNKSSFQDFQKSVKSSTDDILNIPETSTAKDKLMITEHRTNFENPLQTDAEIIFGKDAPNYTINGNISSPIDETTKQEEIIDETTKKGEIIDQTAKKEEIIDKTKFQEVPTSSKKDMGEIRSKGADITIDKGITDNKVTAGITSRTYAKVENKKANTDKTEFQEAATSTKKDVTIPVTESAGTSNITKESNAKTEKIRNYTTCSSRNTRISKPPDSFRDEFPKCAANFKYTCEPKK